MSLLILLLRAVSLLAFAGPALLNGRGHEGETTRARRESGGRAPVVANFTAFGSFLGSLLMFARSADALLALPLALTGCVVALSGAALVVRSRIELGAAWALVPKADHDAGIVTTGPYRLVRHPIYLGLALLAFGQALAFGNWPALLILLFGVIPTFMWRAIAEEKLLRRAFGDRYAAYQQRTKMIVPYLL